MSAFEPLRAKRQACTLSLQNTCLQITPMAPACTASSIREACLAAASAATRRVSPCLLATEEGRMVGGAPKARSLKRHDSQRAILF